MTNCKIRIIVIYIPHWFRAFCPIKLNIHSVSNMKKDLNKKLSYLKKIELYFLIVCGRFMYLVHSYTEQIFSSKIITRNGKLMIITKLIQFIILWYSWKIAHLTLNNNRSITAIIFDHLPFSYDITTKMHLV